MLNTAATILKMIRAVHNYNSSLEMFAVEDPLFPVTHIKYRTLLA